jgi:SAM-dependent methyltransferase
VNVRAKWNARHGANGPPGEPAVAVVELERFVPRAGRALDVAGGAGRHALWLARRGLAVTLVDIADVGLGLARAAAGAAGVALATVALDLDAAPLPLGPWDLVLCTFFLDRRIYATFPELLAPGGTLIVVHPTLRNRERHEQPPPEFLLEPGELFGLVGGGLEVLHADEGWGTSGRHEARVVARRA